MSKRLGPLMVIGAVPLGLALGMSLAETAADPSARGLAAEPAAAIQEEKKAGFEIAGRRFESQEQFVQSGRRCDTPVPTENQIRRARLAADAVRRIAGVEDYLNPQNPVTIPVAFHVIHKGDQGKVTPAQIDQQICVLDKAFETSGFDFELKEVDFSDVEGTEREDWFTMGHFSAEEREAKRLLGKDPERYLNIYTANLGASLLGWATFPSDLAGDVERDGVVLLYTSLPAEDGTPNPDGGPFGLGHTGTHEVGHWLGLYHTFQGGCVPPGDEVADTPAHQVNFGCPSNEPDTCTLDMKKDPIHNFMNYTDDDCMNELTGGQIGRMREQTTTFRPLLYVGTSDLRGRIREAARAAGR